MFILQYEAVKGFTTLDPSSLSQDCGGGVADAQGHTLVPSAISDLQWGKTRSH